MVNSFTEEIGKNTEEGECDGDSLEVKAIVYSSYFSYFKKLSSLASSTSCPQPCLLSRLSPVFQAFVSRNRGYRDLQPHVSFAVL